MLAVGAAFGVGEGLAVAVAVVVVAKLIKVKTEKLLEEEVEEVKDFLVVQVVLVDQLQYQTLLEEVMVHQVT